MFERLFLQVYDMDHRSVSEDMVIEPYAGVNQIQAEYVIMVMIKEYHYCIYPKSSQILPSHFN